MAKSPKKKKKDLIQLSGNIRPTADYIAYFAALDSSKIGLIDGKVKISYGKFDSDIKKMIIAAQKFKLDIGQTVAVEWVDLYHHWLFLIAFEALGIATISYTKSELKNYWTDFDDIDLVICSSKKNALKADQIQIASKPWITAILAKKLTESFKLPLIQPNIIVRVHCSSGTTGNVKRMRRSAKVNEYRITQFQFKEGFNRNSKFIFNNAFSVHAIYGRATACIRMGGACIMTDDRYFADITIHQATHVCTLPIVLEKILTSIPKAYRRPKNLSVSTFGGPISDSLRKIILSKFAAQLIESYGTNEVGSITTTAPNGIGIILPQVLVEVLNGKGKAIIGEAGAVRVKCDGMIDGYINDSEATKKMFKSGWFYPGDIGVMPDDNSLILEGRSDDLINVGGIKINPLDYEKIIKRNISAKDVCFSALKGRFGLSQIWIAVTTNSSMTLNDIKDILTPILPASLGIISYIKIKNMPRTETGKIQRGKIPEEISRILSSKAPAKQTKPNYA